MLGLFNQSSFSGHWIRVEIEGFRVEKLISKAIAEGIVFRHIRCISDTCMELTLTAEDFGYFRRLAGSRFRITLIDEGGVRPAMTSFIRNRLLICGLLVFLLVFGVQSLFIREVSVIGCKGVDENAIRECAREAGLYEGALRGFDAARVKTSIFESFDNIVWVKVATQGNYAEIRIAEAQAESPESAEARAKMRRPCNIVAAQDCYVETVRTFRGVSMVEPDSFVKKGGILISGKIPVEMSTYDEDADKTKTLRVHADGEVIGRVPYYYSFYLNHGEGKRQAEARVREWIKENIPEDAQILNKSLNFQQKENIMKVYGVIETRQQVGIEKEIIFENNSNR